MTKQSSRRHSRKEIAEKLARAEQMVRDGKTQSEIAEILGISVMTFHRWRKASQTRNAARTPTSPGERMREIEAENARLRDFVVRMLLENEELKERV